MEGVAHTRRPEEWIISIDDHLIEPPTLWTSRLPQKYQDRCPQVRDDDKGEAWHYEGKRVFVSQMVTSAGLPPDYPDRPLPIRYSEMNPACYNPDERLKVMDEDGVLAEMCFPNFPRFCGQEFLWAPDKELSLLCVQAYNDFLIDEWNASGRMIPCIIVPLWDARLAAEEVERCAAKGARSVSFSEHPPSIGIPSIHDPDRYWDPLWRAVTDTGMVLSIHIGSSSKVPTTGPDAPMIVSAVLTRWYTASTLCDWLFCSALSRFPNLKISLSEGGIDWFPATIDALNYVLDHHPYLDRYEMGIDMQPVLREQPLRNWPYDGMRPIDVIRRNFRGCFVGGLASTTRATRHVIDELGADLFLTETDYPHGDSSYPNTTELISEILEGLPHQDQERLRQLNAIEWYSLDPSLRSVPLGHAATS